MSFSFVHAADLHLDTPFIGLSHLPPVVRNQVRDSTFMAFNQLVQLCIDKRVDFLVIAGDVYDSSNRSLRAQLWLQEGVKRLSNEGIRVFIAHGNHDPMDGYRAQLTWPNHVHIFSSETVEGIPVFKNNEEIARVYGVSYATREVSDRLAQLFIRDPTARYAIGVLHTNVGGHHQHENYAPSTMNELIKRHMDYWALGHIHTRQVLSIQHPTIVYPGNIQGRSIKETGEKGCFLVNVTDEGRTSFTFHPLDQIRWLDLSIEMEGCQSEQELIDRLDDEIGFQKDHIGNRSIIFKLSLRVGEELAELCSRQAFVEDLVHRYRQEKTPFLWLQNISIEAFIPEEEDPFLLEMLERVSDLSKDPEFRNSLIQEAAGPLLHEHRLGSKWLTQLWKELMDWEKEVEQLIKKRK